MWTSYKGTLLSEFKDSSVSNGAYKVHEVIEAICFMEIALKMAIKKLNEKDKSLHCPLLVAAP